MLCLNFQLTVHSTYTIPANEIYVEKKMEDKAADFILHVMQ